jgi:hypothetical protein
VPTLCLSSCRWLDDVTFLSVGAFLFRHCLADRACELIEGVCGQGRLSLRTNRRGGGMSQGVRWMAARIGDDECHS